MTRPKPDFPSPADVEKYLGPSPQQIEARRIKFIADTTHHDRELFLAYREKGFTEEQALALTVARGGTARMVMV